MRQPRFGKQVVSIRRRDGRISVSTYTGKGWMQLQTYNPYDIKNLKRRHMDYLERVGYQS